MGLACYPTSVSTRSEHVFEFIKLNSEGRLAMQLFENDYVMLSLDENVPCLEWIGKGHIPSEVFRESEEKSLQFYLQYKGKYPHLGWFVDARKIGALFPADTQWVADEILPRFATAGLKKEGFVVPTSALGKMTVHNYESQAGDRIEIEVFDTVEDAKNWLRI